MILILKRIKKGFVLTIQLNEGEKDGEFTLRNILDLFKSWQQNEIVHPNWFGATKTDLNYFLQEEQVGVIFLPLSEHRTISRNLISKFEVQAAKLPVGRIKQRTTVVR